MTPKTLDQYTPEQRGQMVGMWCDLETNKGTQQVVLYKMVEEHTTGPVAYRLSFTSRHVVLGFDPEKLTPRFDLLRAWTPDGKPVDMEPQESEVDYGWIYHGDTERTHLPDGASVRRFATDWEVQA